MDGGNSVSFELVYKVIGALTERGVTTGMLEGISENRDYVADNVASLLLSQNEGLVLSAPYLEPVREDGLTLNDVLSPEDDTKPVWLKYIFCRALMEVNVQRGGASSARPSLDLLLSCTEDELLCHRGVGPKTIAAVQSRLAELGLPALRRR